MDDAQELFVAKVDAFAASLEAEEQAMLIELLVGDDGEVSGFGFKAGWPGLATLGVSTVGSGSPEGFISSGGGSPTVFRTEPDYTGFAETGGGNPSI